MFKNRNVIVPSVKIKFMHLLSKLSPSALSEAVVYRIQKAKELMENSNLSGKAIAQEVGFNHVRSFYRLLKKHIGDIEE